MSIKRIARHLLAHHWRVRRIFPPEVLARIAQAIRAGEATHAGQVRFVVEGALDGRPLLRNQPARERALDLFAQLRIWDTAHNNGVLIYLLLADRAIEIVADRGLARTVSDAQWSAVMAPLRTALAAGEFEAGLTAAVDAVAALLSARFAQAPGARDENELPDRPRLI